MHSLIRRPARTILLAGLVGFTLIGSTGVAFATPSGSAPLEHGYKPAKVSKRAAAATEPDVPTVDRDLGCLIPKAPSSGPGVGVARVTITDRHEPAAAAEYIYKVTLLKNEGGENYKEFKSVPDVKTEAGKDSKPVEFKDIPGGTYKVQAQLVKDGKPIDGIVTEKSELDRCSEIKGPVTGPLQVFQRCDTAKGGLLTIRAFAQSEAKKDYTITVTGEADRSETDLSTAPDGQNYGIPYNEVPFADGTYTVRVYVKGDSKIDQSQVITVACKASHQPTTTNPAPPAKPAPPVSNVADTKGLANTGASVLWPAVGGIAVLALGGGLVLFSRRRGTTTSK